MDKAKLAKVMALTASQVPGEAFAALGRANKMLADAGLTWETLLLPPEEPTGPFGMKPFEPAPGEPGWVATHLTDKVVIEAMFRAIYAMPQDGSDYWTWLDNVKNDWDRFGALSQKQYDGVRRSYNRAIRSAQAR